MFQANRLSVTCRNCNHQFDFPGVFDLSKGAPRCGLACAQCNRALAPAYLCNSLTLEMRKHITAYYSSELVCDDSACKRSMRAVSVRGAVCTDPLCRGRVHPVRANPSPH